MHFVEKICQTFQNKRIPYAIVGGYAVALHGAPRGTLDLDLVISHNLETFLAAQEALNSLGFLPRLPIDAENLFHFKDEYIQNRNLIAWSFYNKKNPIEMVDIIITHNLDDLITVQKSFQKQSVSVVSKNDLIQIKQKSNRPQDIQDIEALKKL